VNVYQARPAGPQIHILGEGPVWDAPRRRLIWVDVNAGRVHIGRLAGDQLDQVEPQSMIQFDETVGAAVCSSEGDLLVAGARGLLTIHPDGSRTAGPQLVPEGRNSRLNDGACDPAGRFLVGSLALDDRRAEEFLVRIDRAGDTGVVVIDNDLTLSNGLAWSPDGTVFYSIDTVPRVIYARRYDAETGHCGERSPFLEITDGSPDGMCADREGNLWVAIWGAGQVRCFSPTGAHLASVEVAAPNTSSVAFVGDDLDVLLITTASEQLSAEHLVRFPDSGKLFTARVGVTGLPVPMWSPAP
jgi:sugar lactone lactonase YvrE